MFVRAGDKIIFLFEFTDSDGNPMAPTPTPTAAVFRIDVNAGTSSQVVTGGTLTALATTRYFYVYTSPSSGYYAYLAEAATTDTNVAQQTLPCWGVSGAAWSENMDAAITTRATPAQVNTEADAAISDAGLVAALAVVDGNVDSILVDTATTIPALITSTSTGGGSIAWTIYVDDGTNPLEGVQVWVTTDIAGNNTIASGNTDTLGKVILYLDAGTYYCWKQRTNYNFTNPQTFAVS